MVLYTEVQEIIKMKHMLKGLKVVVIVSCLLSFITSCKKDIKHTEINVYYDSGEIESISYLNGDGTIVKVRTFFKSGVMESESEMNDDVIHGKLKSFFENKNIKLEATYINGLKSGKYIVYYVEGGVNYKANYLNDLENGEYISYYKNGDIEFLTNFKDGKVNGKEVSYYENGIIKSQRFFDKGKIVGDLISYDNSSRVSMYSRYNHFGNLQYKLDIDSLRVLVKEAGNKFAYVGLNVTSKGDLIPLKLKDSLKLTLEIANPPSCKKVLYTRLNGITKDSLEISGKEYYYTVLPTELGNNKLELFLDYYCKDYKLKPDYFTLDFEVVE